MCQIDHPNPDEKDCRLWRVLTIGLVVAIAYTFVQKMIEYWMSPNVVWPSALGRVGRGMVRRTDDMSLLDSLLLLSVLVVLSTPIVIRETRYWLHIRRSSFIVAVPASIYLLVVYFADICDPNHLGQFCWDCQTHWGESGTTRCAINKVLQTIEGCGSVFGYGCYALVLGAVVPSTLWHIRKRREYASAVVLARLSNIGLVALLVLALFFAWIFARELVIALMDSVTSVQLRPHLSDFWVLDQSQPPKIEFEHEKFGSKLTARLFFWTPLIATSGASFLALLRSEHGCRFRWFSPVEVGPRGMKLTFRVPVWIRVEQPSSPLVVP